MCVCVCVCVCVSEAFAKLKVLRFPSVSHPVLLVHLKLGCGANFETLLFGLVHLSGS